MRISWSQRGPGFRPGNRRLAGGTQRIFAPFVAKDGFQNSAMLLSADETRLAGALAISEPRSKWNRANFSRGDEA